MIYGILILELISIISDFNLTLTTKKGRNIRIDFLSIAKVILIFIYMLSL